MILDLSLICFLFDILIKIYKFENFRKLKIMFLKKNIMLEKLKKNNRIKKIINSTKSKN